MERRIAVATAVVGLLGCGPRVNPEGPGTEPSVEPVAKVTPSRSSQPPTREVLVGEMCPAAAAGRAGVMPLVVRRLSWDDNREQVALVLERNMARQFSVLGWDGRRVGVFSVAGAASGPAGTFAAGSYAGGGSCEARPSSTGESEPVPECEKTMLSCGLAVALVRPAGGAGSAPFEEDPDPAAFRPAGACTAGDKLLVDVDGDGAVEAFPTADFLGPMRAPAEEVLAVDAGSASCVPQFASRAVLPAGDPRDWRGLDIVGVLDLDGDGRSELIAAYNYQSRRTWAVYSAQSSAGRLDLVGEGVAWPR